MTTTSKERVYATPPDFREIAKYKVDHWNRMYPIGTPVKLEQGGSYFHTRTASHAELDNRKTSAIIWLDRIEGCQSLYSVYPSYMYCHECALYPCPKSAAIEQCMKDQGFNKPFSTVANGCDQFTIHP